MIIKELNVWNKLMSKTSDVISKKRQRLWQEIDFWRAREREVRVNSLWPQNTQAKIQFCRQEVAKRQKELFEIKRGTAAQRNAGWK